MIYETLHRIVTELNEYLMDIFNVKEPCAILNVVVDQDGSIPEHCLNKMVVSIVNLEHDSNTPYNPVYKNDSGNYQEFRLAFNFNIDVLITAVFDSKNYDEGLKFLSRALMFFQGKPVFTPANTDGMQEEVQQVSSELIRLSYHEEHSLWGALGAKYMPSVLLKLRLVSFQSGKIRSTSPEISKSDPSVVPAP